MGRGQQGLGLAITKLSVERFSRRIEPKRTQDLGSAFRIVIEASVRH